MHAVILAGGKGTRLRPLTDSVPKPLLPFLVAPFAVGLLRRLAQVGVTRATFLVGQDAAPWARLHDLAADLGMVVDVATEEAPLDTAGACRRLLATPHDQPVLVCNGDILTDLDLAGLLDAHGAAGATATIALTRVLDTATFGVVVRDGRDHVQRFVEKPAPGTLTDDTVNAGTYVLAPDAFGDFPGDGPLSFERAVFPGLVGGGRVVLGVVSDAYWADLGTPQRYLDGHRDVLDGRCTWPLDSHVVHSGTTAVHTSAQVDPSAKLVGFAVLGAGAHIGVGATVEDSVLHDGARVAEGVVVTRCILGPGVVAEADVADTVMG